jgi:hypothetical protein
MSLAPSSLRCAPYILVSLCGILGDALGGIIILLVVSSLSSELYLDKYSLDTSCNLCCQFSRDSSDSDAHEHDTYPTKYTFQL